VKYVLLTYTDPAQTKAMTAEDRETVARKHAALRTELINSGELLDGAGLAYPADTTTLRLDDGMVAITRGAAEGIDTAPDGLLPARTWPERAPSLPGSWTPMSRR
jgi:hypothetical protein